MLLGAVFQTLSFQPATHFRYRFFTKTYFFKRLAEGLKFSTPLFLSFRGQKTAFYATLEFGIFRLCILQTISSHFSYPQSILYAYDTKTSTDALFYACCLIRFRTRRSHQ
ncbi:hypothetical protein [Hugenholtzia roseola]|uniref:hypothetical protein n=1 Tax=Hugenholtzia roseola TaxID=1002 RepID=UPI001376B014|nr:hypothetical protein [Hugenholtzia roseola]